MLFHLTAPCRARVASSGRDIDDAPVGPCGRTSHVPSYKLINMQFAFNVVSLIYMFCIQATYLLYSAPLNKFRGFLQTLHSVKAKDTIEDARLIAIISHRLILCLK